MIEILQFVFQSFWHFTGTILLMLAMATIVSSFRRRP